MRKTRMFTLLAVTLGLMSAAHAQVKESIDGIIRDPYLKNVEIGIKLVRLGDSPATDQVIYERHADLPLTPASNLKLLTTACALDTFGADFQFKTVLAQKDQTLALIGDGDPALGDAEMLKKVGWKSTTLFEKWAQALVARGLTKASELHYDDSIFDQTFQHPNWPNDQIHKRYVAGVAGLNFNANCLDFYLKPRGQGETVSYEVDPPESGISIENNCIQGPRNAVWLSRASGSDDIILKGQTPAANGEPFSVTVNNPSHFSASVLLNVFARNGIEITGKPVHDVEIRKSIKDWTTLAVHETPLKQVLMRANKDSMNVYAEALFKRLGHHATQDSGTWASGVQAMSKYLAGLGNPDNQFTLDDGSGLSRKNAVSPNVIMSVLRSQYHGKNSALYLSTLAVAGVDGTLENRFNQTPLKERVFAKSGFIDGVSALSGFAKDNQNQWYAFVILFNGIGKQTNATAKKLQERIVLSIE